MRPIKQIIVHHSESPGGDAAMIKEWHTSPSSTDSSKPWRDIGYHFVICNGKTHGNYSAGADGEVQKGRPVEEAGAHARNHNADSIGICLIGNFEETKPTRKQLRALVDLLAELCAEYELHPFDAIKGHRDVCATECPGKFFYPLMLPLKVFTEAVMWYAD